MNTILIVAEAKGHLLLSIKEKLKSFAYHTTEVAADTDAIMEVSEPVSAILIYTDEMLIKQQLPLNFIRERAIRDDIPIFVVGESADVKVLKDTIPADLIRMEFLRPLNVNGLVETIDAFMKRFSVKKKILVVDDSGAALRTAKEWLQDKYNVFLANSGAMAIKYLTLNQPDLVLLDYDMPVCDGKQVLEMIRTETDFADTPVMFLTNKADPHSILNVKELKPEGYLLKSMAPHLIIKAIDDYFELKKGMI